MDQLDGLRRFLGVAFNPAVNAQRVLGPGQLNDHLLQAQQAQLPVGLAVFEWCPLGAHQRRPVRGAGARRVPRHPRLLLPLQRRGRGRLRMSPRFWHRRRRDLTVGVEAPPPAAATMRSRVGPGARESGALSHAGDITVAHEARARVAAAVVREPRQYWWAGTMAGRGSTRRLRLRRRVRWCRMPG
jgi:hypothetical protein